MNQLTYVQLRAVWREQAPVELIRGNFLLKCVGIQQFGIGINDLNQCLMGAFQFFEMLRLSRQFNFTGAAEITIDVMLLHNLLYRIHRLVVKLIERLCFFFTVGGN
jgi:hypothetical protein